MGYRDREQDKSWASSKGVRRHWKSEDHEDDFGYGKSKKSGKRFHRKKTMKERYWEGLPENGE